MDISIQTTACRGEPVPGKNGTVEISVVTAGTGWHRLLNETAECRPGDMYILQGELPHCYSGEELTVQTLTFPAGEECYGIFRDDLPVSYALLNNRAMEQVLVHFAAISEELDRQEQDWQVAVRSHLSLLLILLGRYIDQADTAHRRHPKEWVAVSAALREIGDRFGDSAMTLDSVAAAVFLSSSQLSRLFRRVVGQSFQEYVRSVRLGHACRLLRYTGLTNEEIVRQCGLKDVPTFYRLFKNETGTTPYQYRMSNIENEEKGEKIMIITEISESLQRGKAKDVERLVTEALEQGVPAARILNEGLLSGMNVVGEKFKRNEVYVPEVLVAARAMNKGIAVLKPHLAEDGVKAKGKVCIGTVQGDLHDIGKNLVKMMMEGKGLEVIDLGTDVAPENFVQTAKEQGCQVICCSALLTTTMDVMADVVKAAEAAGIRDQVKIMVGGAPVTEEYCQKIGADCYTSDAASAADAAVELCR
ncbi:MAG: B12-binding domain-containing protein [Clostridia bacterium]|nr:B12-binding domain-containing protein [Clostridia bacterium]